MLYNKEDCYKECGGIPLIPSSAAATLSASLPFSTQAVLRSLPKEQAMLWLEWMIFVSGTKAFGSLVGKVNKLTALGSGKSQVSSEAEAMGAAIDFLSEAMLLTPDSHPAKPTLLCELAGFYEDRYGSFKEPPDVDKAIEYYRLALALTPSDHPDRAGQLNKLGISYRRRFYCLDEVEDLNKAIDCHRQAMSLISEGHEDKAETLHNLGLLYQLRYACVKDLADISKAIDFQRQVLLWTPDDHENRVTRLDRLGFSYQCRFEHLGELADIDEAIEQYSHAVQLASHDIGAKAQQLDHLGTACRVRFDHCGGSTDLENALSYHSQAALSTPDGHPSKPTVLTNLGRTYQCRIARYNHPADIERAIECQTQSLQLTSNGDTEKPGRLSNLAGSYRFRFLRSSKLEDFNKAIDLQNQAILLTPDGYTKSAWLGNLASTYMIRFHRFGELSDIDMAIDIQSRSMLLIPDNHTAKPTSLLRLGVAYHNRFERYGELMDLKKSIEYLAQAVLLTPGDHANKPGLLTSLGNSYRSRYRLHGAIDDLDAAIDCHSQAVLSIPDGHCEKPGLLSNLGNSYQSRFQRYGKLADINMAIEFQSRAVMLTSDDQLEKPVLLGNLGNAYTLRFQSLASGELLDINKAIDCHCQAVSLTPDDYSAKSSMLALNGQAYLHRYLHDQQGERSDLEKANVLFHQATQLAITNPIMQLGGVRGWVMSSLLLGISPEPAYQRAMELMPQLVWIGTTIDQRYNLLIEVGDLAMEAAAGAIAAKSYDLAIERLEQGRSIVWNQILQLRTPFDDLLAVDPALAHRLKDISSELERASSRSQPTNTSDGALSLEQEAQHHHRLAVEWDQLLQQARCLPGFHDFMCPPKANTLIHAAKDGPLVVINIHRFRCDALIIPPNSNDIAHVALENFSIHKAADAHSQLMSLVGQRGGRAGGFRRLKSAPSPEQLFKRVLVTLWCDLVEPILDFLGYLHKPPTNVLPHVTWCTTGALSFLPLHAAGCYDGVQPNAFDLITSSYTPTLSALLAAIDPLPDTSTGGVLAIGQEHTTGLSELPNTILELEAIKEHAEPTGYLQLDGDKATVDAVLNAMDKYSCVHLACHATQQPNDPTQSAFHLHDGNLTLSAITKRVFKQKSLAFLSACQTATGDSRLPDEAIHLAAGMLMAGYPSVIATMWGIFDGDAPEVAREVYADVLKDGKINYAGASRALHKAVAGLREKVGLESFARWVPFIHLGV